MFKYSQLEFKFDKGPTIFFKISTPQIFHSVVFLENLNFMKKCIPAPMVKGSEVTLKTSESSFTAFSEMYAS